MRDLKRVKIMRDLKNKGITPNSAVLKQKKSDEKVTFILGLFGAACGLFALWLFIHLLLR
tara:strand:- start:982 stop:1161 length:180 start_codon:yes stop_codon:yes gene_type:complete